MVRHLENLPIDRRLTLPGTTAATRTGGEVASDLRGTRKERRCDCQWRRQSKSTAAIRADVVLVGSELTTLSCDTLEVLLSRSVGISNLKQKTFFTDGLAMEVSDDLVANLSTLKAGKC